MMVRCLRGAVVLVVVGLFGTTGVASATSWVVSLTSAAKAAQSRSTQVNAPTSGQAITPTSTSLALSWTAPTSGPVPSGYTVTRNGSAVQSGSSCFGTINTTSCTDSGLSTNTTYTYSITAVLGSFWQSNASSTFQGTTGLFVTGITSTNKTGNTAGTPGNGDTIAITFNNPLNTSTIATAVTETMILCTNDSAFSSTCGSTGGTQSDIVIPGLTTSAGFITSSRYWKSGNYGQATGTLSLSNSNKTVTFTLNETPVAGNGGTVAGSVGGSTFTFAPLATINDTSGEPASNSFIQSTNLQLF